MIFDSVWGQAGVSDFENEYSFLADFENEYSFLDGRERGWEREREVVQEGDFDQKNQEKTLWSNGILTRRSLTRPGFESRYGQYVFFGEWAGFRVFNDFFGRIICRRRTTTTRSVHLVSLRGVYQE